MSDTSPPPIVLYVTPTCPYCRQVREFLTRRGVPFTMYDVSQDPDALREMVWRSGQRGVPVVVVGDEVIVGFDLERLRALLPLAGRPPIKLGLSIATARAAEGRPAGAYVGNVAAGLPAGLAGVQRGDIIVEMARQPVHDAPEVHAILASLQPGMRVALTVWRAGREVRLVVRL